MRAPLPILCSCVGLALTACGPTPPNAMTQSLFDDLDRIVETQSRTEWLIDRLELEEVAPHALRSVCQTPLRARRELDVWLTKRIAETGGPAREAWLRNGRDLDAVAEPLRLERVRAALRYADTHAESSCPFWLEVDDDFAGVQGDAERFVLYIETAGGFTYELGDEDSILSGGGAGRVLVGYGLTPRYTLVGGAEIGGGGRLPKDESGTRSFEARLVMGAPIILRAHFGTWLWDSELAVVAQASENNLSHFRTGVRVAQGVGLSAIRIRNLLPYGLFWIGYEYSPAQDGFEEDHVIRAGTRFGVDFAP